MCFCPHVLNKYSHPWQSGMLKERHSSRARTQTDIHTRTPHKARKSVMLKTGKMPQRHSRNLIRTAGRGRRMNNSDSLIHLTKFCQTQAETHGLWTELPQLNSNMSLMLNGKPTVSVRSDGGRGKK